MCVYLCLLPILKRLDNECRYDERLKTKPEESTRLSYTGLLVELEHLKIETTFIDECCGKEYGRLTKLMLFIINRENER
jgi:hypothetical protein